MVRLGVEKVDPLVGYFFNFTFDSFIGPPSTALLLLPLTLFPYDVALTLYRATILIGFGLSLWLVSQLLPAPQRSTAVLCGGAALLVSDPFAGTFVLAQVDVWVVLALATCVWSTHRQIWWLAGCSVAVAALLKISPAVLIFYFLLKGKRRAVMWALLAVAVLIGLASAIGLPEDTLTFVHQVIPEISEGAFRPQNQSLPAWIVRIVWSVVDTQDAEFAAQVLRYLSVAIMIIGAIGLWLITRYQGEHSEMSPLELGALVPLAILAGPVTWDHYITWTIVLIVQLLDSTLWERENWRPAATAALGVMLLSLPSVYYPPESLHGNLSLAILSGTKVFGLLVLLCVAVTRLKRRLSAAKNPMTKAKPSTLMT
jgi:alpha-1,2-mannosyltransferase